MNVDLLQELLKFAEQMKAANAPYSPERWFIIKNGEVVTLDLGGLICMHEPFQKLGLYINEVRNKTTGELLYAEPAIGKWEVCYGAMRVLFDLTEDQAEYIFCPDEIKVLTLEGYDVPDEAELAAGAELPEVDLTLDGAIARIKRVINGEIE